MKNYLFIVCALLCALNLSAQQSKIDSLTALLKTDKEDTNKINHLQSIAWELATVNPDTALKFANDALHLSQKITFSKTSSGWQMGIGLAYHTMGWIYYNSGNYPQSLQFYQKAMDVWEVIEKNEPQISKALLGIRKSRTLGNMCSDYMQQGDFPLALDYSYRSLKIGEAINDKIGNAANYVRIGNIYGMQSDFSKAVVYYFKALKIYEELNNKNGVKINLMTIGTVYHSQHQFLQALQYYFKSLKLGEETNDKYGMSIILGNIGLAYADSAYLIGVDSKHCDSLYNKALDFYFKALSLAEEVGYKSGMATHLGNIGVTYDNQKNYSKALEYYLKALKLGEEIGYKIVIVDNLGQVGSVYVETKKYAQAENYLLQALAIDTASHLIKQSQFAHEQLSNLYSQEGNYKKALEHFKKAMVAKDTLFNQEKNQDITRNEMNYDFDKKEAAAKAEQEKKDILEASALKNQEIQKYSFAGAAILLCILAIVLFNRYRLKQSLQLQKIRNKISNDLHDDIGSTLSSISIYTELAKQRAQKEFPAATEYFEQIREDSRGIIENMSDIVWMINPKNDSTEILVQRMENFATQFLQSKNIEFYFEADKKINGLKLSMESRRNLYLIFKEAINNSVKYSECKKVTVKLEEHDGAVHMVVTDDGKGFDVSQNYSGNGLHNFKSRAEEMNGTIAIDSSVGKGTTINLQFKTT